MFNATVRFWREWLGRSTYPGPLAGGGAPLGDDAQADDVRTNRNYRRGAYDEPPGAAEGGERNWDYHFTWIRDGSFSIYALLGLGYTDEAAAFGRWLADRASERARDGSGPLKIMYRIDSGPDLDEEVLDHLEGYRGSGPVRIGNGAFGSAAARHLRRGDGLRGHQGSRRRDPRRP